MPRGNLGDHRTRCLCSVPLASPREGLVARTYAPDHPRRGLSRGSNPGGALKPPYEALQDSSEDRPVAQADSRKHSRRRPSAPNAHVVLLA